MVDVSSSILVQGSAMLIEVLTPIEPLGVFVVERSGTEGSSELSSRVVISDDKDTSSSPSLPVLFSS